MTSRIGIIGGSGLYELPGFNLEETRKIETPFGEPSDVYRLGTLGDRKVVFLPRHASRHNIPPHQVNYRANIFGMQHLEVERIIAVSAVGGIHSDFTPGDLVVPDQIIDMTKNRKNTFYEGEPVTHVDFTEPFCSGLQREIATAADKLGIALHSGGTYLCVEGPRYETAAEIRFFASIGAGLVGMTAMPEAVLARELGLCYSLVSVVTNPAAGISKEKLNTDEVVVVMQQSLDRVKELLKVTANQMTGAKECSCAQSLDRAAITRPE